MTPAAERPIAAAELPRAARRPAGMDVARGLGRILPSVAVVVALLIDPAPCSSPSSSAGRLSRSPSSSGDAATPEREDTDASVQ